MPTFDTGVQAPVGPWEADPTGGWGARQDLIGSDWRLFTRKDLRSAQAQPGLPELDRISNRIEELHFEHDSGGERPRANKWRPFRLAINGTIVAHTCIRASEAYVLTEVDAFGTRPTLGIDEQELIRAVLVLVLTDAVVTGRSLALQFTDKGDERRPVPSSIRDYAAARGITLTRGDSGSITPDEARALFLCATFGDDHETCRRVRDLEYRQLLSPERVCALAGQGIWSPTELRIVLSQCPFPEEVLGRPERTAPRLISDNAQLHGMAAMLVDTYRRALAAGIDVCPDWLRAAPSIELEDESGVAILPIRQETPSPWFMVTNPGRPLPHGTLGVIARPLGAPGIHTFAHADIEAAWSARQRLPLDDVLVLYPADAHELSDTNKRALADLARQSGVSVCFGPDSVGILERQYLDRIRRGRSIRR